MKNKKYELIEEIEQCEFALNSMNKNEDVMAYVLLSNKLQKLQAELFNLKNKGVVNAEADSWINLNHDSDYPLYLWMYDFRYNEIEKNKYIKEKVLKGDPKFEFRLYKDFDTGTDAVIPASLVEEFEEKNNVLIINEYTYMEDGVDIDKYNELRNVYLYANSKEDKTRKRTK